MCRRQDVRHQPARGCAHDRRHHGQEPYAGDLVERLHVPRKLDEREADANRQAKHRVDPPQHPCERGESRSPGGSGRDGTHGDERAHAHAERAEEERLCRMEEHDPEELRPDDVARDADTKKEEEEEHVEAKDDVADDAQPIELVGQLVEQDRGDARAHGHAEPARGKVHGDATDLLAEALCAAGCGCGCGRWRGDGIRGRGWTRLGGRGVAEVRRRIARQRRTFLQVSHGSDDVVRVSAITCDSGSRKKESGDWEGGIGCRATRPTDASCC
ncbi:hypothetical protein L1887_60631 [Cichorium endivia]|nr:hypothetical protein L1887_60631 [Cichorium endivia]